MEENTHLKTENKQRTNVWLAPALLAKIDSQLETTDSKTRSEYLTKAAEFYTGYIASSDAENYISSALLGEVDKRLKQNEAHISKTLFKLATEGSMALHVIASLGGVDTKDLPNLQKHCIKEVKASLGRVNFQTIYEEYVHE